MLEAQSEEQRARDGFKLRQPSFRKRRAMPDPDLNHLNLTTVNNVVLVEITTKDIQGPALAQELGAELGRVAAQDWAKKLLVDFKRVRYLSSTGFAVLFRVVRDFKAAGGQIKLCNMDPQIRLGAEIVGLEQVVEICATEAAAMASFA
jgi:anti-sigma B factor antagonist